MEVGEWESCLRMAIATAAAAPVGWEREARRRAAGLRTHVLVALGSCTFMILGLRLADPIEPGVVTLWDPLRVLQGIVGGVGFLGAGAILESRGRVRGLTTAAGIWVVAASGAAAGAGFHWVVLATTILTLLTLIALRRLELRAFAEPPSDPADPT